jgi:4-hydroxybenzoate polyprenyltransferase
MIKKLRTYADIGRTQGITTTASIAIVGALTSTAQVEWYHIIYFTIIAVFAHMALNTYIALGDIELDVHTYVPSRNPVSSGILLKKDALNFVYWCTYICAALILIPPLYYKTISSLLALLCFLPSYIWLIWYGWKGKKFVFSYDFSFSVSYVFFVLFGVFVVGGIPTIYTWIFIGIVIFAATAFAQWENGLKDVNADRIAGVRSFAVLTNLDNNEKLYLIHPYFIYGCILKAGFLLCCFITFLYNNNIFFLIFLFVYGIPSQIFIMYRFLIKKHPIEHRKTILFDVLFAAILGYSVIIEKTGILIIIFLMIYLVGGYLIGSAIQSNCEFKFSRFSSSK